MYFRDPDGARLELIADPLLEMYGARCRLNLLSRRRIGANGPRMVEAACHPLRPHDVRQGTHPHGVTMRRHIRRPLLSVPRALVGATALLGTIAVAVPSRAADTNLASSPLGSTSPGRPSSTRAPTSPPRSGSGPSTCRNLAVARDHGDRRHAPGRAQPCAGRSRAHAPVRGRPARLRRPPHQPAADAGVPLIRKEVWLDLRIDSLGRGVAISLFDWRIRKGDAGSVVIHAQPTDVVSGAAEPV